MEGALGIQANEGLIAVNTAIAGSREAVSQVRHCERSEAIHAARKNGLLRR
jgi:hypothetical protein